MAKGLTAVKLLCEKDPTLSKEKAAAFITCKNVYVNGELCTDSKTLFPPTSTVELVFPKYVSRGGFKLEHALESFQINVEGLVMLDAGSSTGGFTDCLLQRGAKAVHSVDVGFNQLDYKLRSDSRVLVHEKQNIMTVEALDPKPDAAVADLSFRSIHGAASKIIELTKDGWLIALIKPQFEVPRWQEGFFGVVEDQNLLKETLLNVRLSLQNEGVGIVQAVRSPIKGHKGNSEFLALLKKGTGLEEKEFLALCGI